MSEAVADFHKLEQRLRLTGQFITRTALRIGSGGSGELDGVDLPVLREATGYPLIPGASLKGALRSTIESLVRGAECDNSTGIWSCDPMLDGNVPNHACGWHPQGGRQNVDVEKHCAVCRLFGSHVVASHVRLTDVMIAMDERKRERAPVEIRDGVAIDRDLRVAKDKRKYDFEVVSPGVRFDFEVFVENPKPWLMGLLLIGFDQIADGFTALGGFTSRGLGRVDLAWSQMTIITANDLLNGVTVAPLEGDLLKQQFNTYRRALATRAKGEG